MNRFYLSVALAFFIIILGCKNGKQFPESTINAKVLQSVLDSIYAANKACVGLMVHIEAPDKDISWGGAIGFTDTLNKINLEKEHPVLIASNTKTYVAAAILRLVEQEKINLEDAIENYISATSKILLKKDNYNLKNIKIKHLLSHTSGIFDYAGSDEYVTHIIKNPEYRWTRDMQIEWAVTYGNPLAEAGKVYSYADTNYLLLTEIIETITKQPFYEAIGELIGYSKLGVNSTWFSTLEESPKGVKPLAHQYFTSSGLGSYMVDHSFDLYGGGGLASTMEDLAVFTQNLFSHKVFENANTLQTMYGNAAPEVAVKNGYYFGISSVEYNGVKGYGHGGFWGTAVNYFPVINTTISVAVLERDRRDLRVDLNKVYLSLLQDLE